MDMRQFIENRQQFSLDQLAQYRGKRIAWSPDGTKIIASDEDLQKLIEAVIASGYPPEDCVLSIVPEDDALIGGGSLG